jgi:hypothetical protein
MVLHAKSWLCQVVPGHRESCGSQPFFLEVVARVLLGIRDHFLKTRATGQVLNATQT